jgi:hypothetical protein
VSGLDIICYPFRIILPGAPHEQDGRRARRPALLVELLPLFIVDSGEGFQILDLAVRIIHRRETVPDE